MPTVMNRAHQGLSDTSWSGNPLPGTRYYLLTEHGHPVVSDQDFAGCSPERAGRPPEKPLPGARDAMAGAGCRSLGRRTKPDF